MRAYKPMEVSLVVAECISESMSMWLVSELYFLCRQRGELVAKKPNLFHLG